jgi:hypothetical protein
MDGLPVTDILLKASVTLFLIGLGFAALGLGALVMYAVIMVQK